MCDRSSVCDKPAIMALWYVRTRGTNAGLVVELFMVTDEGHGKSEEDFIENVVTPSVDKEVSREVSFWRKKTSGVFCLAGFQIIP